MARHSASQPMSEV